MQVSLIKRGVQNKYSVRPKSTIFTLNQIDIGGWLGGGPLRWVGKGMKGGGYAYDVVVELICSTYPIFPMSKNCNFWEILRLKLLGVKLIRASRSGLAIV